MTSKLRAAAAALAALALTAPPGPAAADGSPPVSGIVRGIPRLVTTSPADAQRTWEAIRRTSPSAAQLKSLRRHKVDHTVCAGLVDLRELVRSGKAPGFGFRDTIRGRTFARPALARVMRRAMAAFQKEFPGKRVAIGDVAQPGCGALNHGVLVRHLRGDAAASLAERAQIVLSEPRAYEHLRARDLRGEHWRFDDNATRILVEHTVVGQDRGPDGELTLRVASRRYQESPVPTLEDAEEMEALAREMTTRRGRIATDERVTALADGTLARRWVTHWVDRKRRMQLVAVTTHPIRRRLKMDQVLSLRFSGWHPKKPGSFKGERRWMRQPAGSGGPPWRRWVQLYEAGHLSHLSGRDADLSYVTVDNGGHFTVDLERMDVAATWRWLELLVAAGERLKTPIELILVDRKIKRHLAAHLPRRAVRSRVFRQVLRLSGGHDAHHHVRLAATDGRE